MKNKLIILLITVICSNLMADLKWDKKNINEILLPSTRQAFISFDFKNTGENNIEFTKLRASCGSCMRINSNKKIYKPGEEGSINAVYNIKQPMGVINKSINIVYNDGEEENFDKLNMSLSFPKLFAEPLPKSVYWEKRDNGARQYFNNQQPQPKGIRVAHVCFNIYSLRLI